MSDAPQPPPEAPQQPPGQPPPAQPAPAPAPAPPGPKRDTTFGWLAHLLALFTWFIGPLVIWLVKKDEDKYAAFHGKQTMCWVLAVTALVVAILLVSFLFALGFPPLFFIGYCFIWLVGLGNLAYVIVGIVFTAQGKPFRYFFVADKFCAKEFAEAYPGVAA